MRRDCLCLAVALCARLLAAAAALVPSGGTICIDEGAVEKAENVPAADWCLRSGETVAVLSGRTGALQSLKGADVRLGFLTNWRDEPASATLVFADGRTESLTLSARETRVVEGGLPLTRQGKPKEGF